MRRPDARRLEKTHPTSSETPPQKCRRCESQAATYSFWNGRSIISGVCSWPLNFVFQVGCFVPARYRLFLEQTQQKNIRFHIWYGSFRINFKSKIVSIFLNPVILGSDLTHIRILFKLTIFTSVLLISFYNFIRLFNKKVFYN